MAKLPELDVAAIELDHLMSENRLQEAKALALSRLEQGYSSATFSKSLAVLWRKLDGLGNHARRGRPRLDKKPQPSHWYEIGSKVDEFVDGGLSKSAAVNEYVEQGCKPSLSRTSIFERYNYYLDAMAECASPE
ncbi:MAG: hypothetical protein ACFE0R_13835 [Salinarimonas sp.]